MCGFFFKHDFFFFFLGTAEITKCIESQNDKYNFFHEICEEFEAGTMYKRLNVNVSV